MDDLRALAERGNGADRAFVDANLRMAWARSAPNDEARAALAAIHRTVQSAAHDAHAALRAEIASGALRGAALRRVFDGQPALGRDHFVEEVLGVAYPPLEDTVLGRELVTYTPSGYEEIVHAFDVTGLDVADRFLDIGAGLGKVALLATLLTGAISTGIDLDAALVDRARTAAVDVGVPHVRFEVGDARVVPLPPSDIVFMFVPFTGDAFAAVMERVASLRPRFVCCAPLDLDRHQGFVATGAPCSWLQVYSRT